jgi:phytanoyl-CoA dioxygenase PhyH
MISILNLRQMDEAGYCLLPAVFSAGQVDSIIQGLERAFQDPTAAAMRGESGCVYGARNILSLWPQAASVWQQPPLPEILSALLGPGFGLVRGLYFDKPPENTWALPWHKDLTIAVRDNRLGGTSFAKPTAKAGVPHVEAPVQVLERMATARIHLDDVTEENGPLRVIPGSHRTGIAMELGDVAPESILGRAGDVLLMRPLLAHASNRSLAGTARHRRILHLEFAAAGELPDGYEWYEFRQFDPGSQGAAGSGFFSLVEGK